MKTIQPSNIPVSPWMQRKMKLKAEMGERKIYGIPETKEWTQRRNLGDAELIKKWGTAKDQAEAS